MKKLAFLLIPIIGIFVIYQSGLVSFYAAEIDLKDIDVKVIYHDDDDDEEFVGLHNRSRVQFKEGDFSLDPFYEESMQKIADQDDQIAYRIEFENDIIQSTNEPSLIEVCVYENSFLRLKKKGPEFLQDTIYFEYDGLLEVSTKWPAIRRSIGHERSFRIKGELTISGLYNENFIDFHIKRLILFKLKYTTHDYLLGYHGYRAWSNFYIRQHLIWWYHAHQLMGFPMW